MFLSEFPPTCPGVLVASVVIVVVLASCVSLCLWFFGGAFSELFGITHTGSWEMVSVIVFWSRCFFWFHPLHFLLLLIQKKGRIIRSGLQGFECYHTRGRSERKRATFENNGNSSFHSDDIFLCWSHFHRSNVCLVIFFRSLNVCLFSDPPSRICSSHVYTHSLP